MADFTALSLDANVGDTATPAYSALGGANTEWRWTDTNAGGTSALASAAWPQMTRPGAVQIVPYSYAFTADATGQGVYSAAGAEGVTFTNANRLQARWNWDNTGTFASAPIMTAYGDTNHNTPSARATPAGDILAGHATDTTGTALVRSYLKAALYGQVSSVAVPAAALGSDPVAGSGTAGVVTPTAGANWSVWQDLMADIDWLQFAATPAATTANTLHCMLALFTGPNMTPGTLVPKVSLKYTFT